MMMPDQDLRRAGRTVIGAPRTIPQTTVDDRLRMLPPGALKLAELCAPAVRVQPELLRAVRLACGPELSAADESDLWWSGIVMGRSPMAIRMRPDVQRRLRDTAATRLPHARTDSPAYRAWTAIKKAHRNEAATVRLEEEIAWTYMSGGDASLEKIEAELNRALVSFVRHGRDEVLDWWPGAFPRLPEAIGRTSSAQNLSIATAYQLGEDAVTEVTGEGVILDAELEAALRRVPDVDIGVLREGGVVHIGEVDRARGAAVPVPDIPVRVMELRWRRDTPLNTSASEASSSDSTNEVRDRVVLRPGEVVIRQIGSSSASIRTARGDVYEIPDTGRSQSPRRGVTDDFWDDLLAYVRQQVLVPVVGPDLTVARVGDTELPLDTLIGQRLVERYDLTVSPKTPTMGEAVAAFLQQRGHDGVERLYRNINDIITELDPPPGEALRDLAAIDDLRLFVSTTPDRLLAKAANAVRFQGSSATRELAFSPNQSTSEQARNAQPAATADTVVLSLFGQAASTPQYAIHDEDRLEWLYALISDTATLPDWLSYPLKRQPMLFIGCDIPDWIGRFLLRVFSNTRSLERKPFFVVGSPTSSEPSLSNFFATYRRKTLVQQLEMEPAAFVAELRSRWEAEVHRPSRAGDPVGDAGRVARDAATIFISYMREDADAARRLYDAITSLGGDVWLDEQRLQPGGDWERETLTAIRNTVRLFVPIISANTEREREGYVFREWNEAVDRSRSIMGRRFIVPVIVDHDYDGDPSRYQSIPNDFRSIHFGRAPGGDPDAELVTMLTNEIRAMRRTGAA